METQTKQLSSSSSSPPPPPPPPPSSSSSSSSFSSPSSSSSSSSPPHLLLLHTLTAGAQRSSMGSDEQPLVQIGWRLLNSIDHQVIQSACKWIKSSNELKLSDEAKAIGLNETTIQEHGLALEDVLKQLDVDLQQLSIASSVQIVTDGPNALRQVLHPHCARHKITLPDAFFEFVDLRKCFAKAYPHTDQNKSGQSTHSAITGLMILPIQTITSLDQMLTELKVSNELDQSSSIAGDQSKDQEVDREPFVLADEMQTVLDKMTLIVERMIEQGHSLNLTETINRTIYCRGSNCRLEQIAPNTVIRARGLPWQATDADIVRFFAGLNICRGGIALCLSAQGRRNGEALVRFESAEHRELALQRHKHHMGNRYIEMYRATPEDFFAVTAGTNNEIRRFLCLGGQEVIRLRGLPYACTADQIVDFFEKPLNADSNETSHCKVLQGTEGILFVRRPDGKASGEAFVMFNSEQDAVKAMEKHKQSIGTRYIELFRITIQEMQQILNRHQESHRNHSEHNHLLSLQPIQHHQHPYMLHAHIKPGLRLMHINKTVNGNNSSNNHNSSSNNNSSLCNNHLMNQLNRQYVQSASSLTASLSHHHHLNSSALSSAQRRLNPALIDKQSFASNQMAQISAAHYPPISSHSALLTSMPPPQTIPPVIASLPPSSTQQSNNTIQSTSIVPTVSVAQPTMMPTNPNLINVPVSQSQLNCSPKRDCLRLRGLPYEAQVEQILEFLGEHSAQIVLQGVHMVLSSNGQASGEAFIQMRSESAAAATAAAKHHQYMQLGKKQRYIEVFQCSAQDMAALLGTPAQLPFAQPTGAPLPAATAALAAVRHQMPHQPHHFQYSQQMLYWTYPSPPVSPTTYYNAQNTLMALM